MKKIVLIIALFLAGLTYAQIFEPVKWTTSVNKISDTEYELISTAKIEDKWHLYSQKVPEGGPIATTFTYKNDDNAFKLNGDTTEEEGHTVDDPVFEMRIKFFEDQAVFKQNIKIEADVKMINASVLFMACDDKRCLPPNEVDLVFNIPENSPKKKTENTSIITEEPLEIKLNPTSQGLLEPVKWNFTHKKIADLEYQLIFTATIDKGWAIYSQFLGDEGPIPTTFTFNNDTNFERIGDTEESDINKVIKKEPLFDNIEVGKYVNQAVFTQNVKIKDLNTVVKGELQYMACNDKQCIFPPSTSFQFVFNTDETQNTEHITLNTNTGLNNDAVNRLLFGMTPAELKKSDISCKDELNSISSKTKEKKSLWGIFGLSFLGGLLALLTPCVFPMIPLTVSFFTKQSGNKKKGIINSIFYGISIIVIYVLLGTIVTVVFGASALNELSTSVIFNVVFFLLLVVFAISFFGYFEITLPSSWANKVDAQSNRKGFIGIFFMALALAIVSFSCTGPVVGGLLVEAASKGGMAPVFGMLGFSLALALPFSLFAMFPGWLNSLPKSGGWLNTTKVILGFLELALAFKFLSNADLVDHWGILKIEPFLIIWIIIFAGLALYLFGKIKFPHDTPIKKLSFSRVSGGILVTAFVIYLASGFRVSKETNTFKSLTLLSGLAPPVGYSFLYPNACPNNLECFKDLKQGLAHAKKENKPVMIDFTGLACVNCRKMEEHVWPLDKIDGYLRNDYVLISLYVDDKKELPKEEQVEVNRINGGTRLLKNYGHKWAYLQTQFFQTNSQPYYVLLNAKGDGILTDPVGYTPDENGYAQFLECGLEVFNSLN